MLSIQVISGHIYADNIGSYLCWSYRDIWTNGELLNSSKPKLLNGFE